MQKAFLVQDNQLYFQDGDNRFDYFHTDYASSLFVQFPDRHWLMTPTGLKLSNTPFKAFYLAGVPKIDREIQQALKARKSRPQAILKKEAGGLSDFKFTDDLGQLLVKRTILLLYAGEEARAWQELEADVKKYYQSSRWLPELQRDIQELLAAAPY